jgi:hypothetical protein
MGLSDFFKKKPVESAPEAPAKAVLPSGRFDVSRDRIARRHATQRHELSHGRDA